MNVSELNDFIIILTNLKKKFPFYILTVTKWNLKNDVVDSYSDLDIRFILDTYREEDINKFCRYITTIFLKLRKHNKTYSRLFEHPPGFIYTKKELSAGLGLIPDIATWTYIHGDKKIFYEIKNLYNKKKKDEWSTNYYWKLLLNRRDTFSFRNEIFPKNAHIPTLKKYFLAWHYYAIIIYAISGIIYPGWPDSKSSSLKKLKKRFPLLKKCDRDTLFNDIKNQKVSVKKFRDELKSDVDYLRYELHKFKFKKNIIRYKTEPLHLYYIANAMRRARICRHEIYSTHFNEIEIALIARESKDFQTICNYLNIFIKNSLRTLDKLDAEIIELLKKDIESINDQGNLNFSKRKTHKEIYSFLLRSNFNFNNYGFIILQKVENNVSINCLKIKITSRCTRKCNFCIFSNKIEGDMNFNKFKLILQKFNKIHINKIFINGGEPTLHANIGNIGKYLKNNFPNKEIILGTNATIISHSDKLFITVAKYFNTFAIGCDDEHKNFKDVEILIPKLKALNKKIIINTLKDYISPKNKMMLKILCNKYHVINVYNKLHHFKIGKKQKITKICKKNNNVDLMVTINGDCYRCFNSVDRNKPEFNINDKNLKDKIFANMDKHYDYCFYCDDYNS